MKNSGNALARAALLALCLLPAAAGRAAGAGTDREGLGGSLAITNTVGLQFGRLAPSAAPGSVTMTPLGVRLPIGGVATLNGGAPSAAGFSVTGSPLTVYAIVLPPNGTVSLTSAAGPAMAVGSFLSLPALVGTLSLAGSQTLLVGATLAVGANQPGGTYSGLFTVTVAFD